MTISHKTETRWTIILTQAEAEDLESILENAEERLVVDAMYSLYLALPNAENPDGVEEG